MKNKPALVAIAVLAILAVLASCGGRGQKKAAAVENEQPTAAITDTVTDNEEYDDTHDTPDTYRGYKFGEVSSTIRHIRKDSLPHLTARDSFYTSNIRLCEELSVGRIYTDAFEYLDYNDKGDDLSITVIKNDKIYNFVSNKLWAVIVEEPQFKTGYMLAIDWKIDFMTPAGDDEALWVVKFAEKITKSE